MARSDLAPAPSPTHDDVPVTEFFVRIYRFFYSKTVGLLLILAMAVVTLLGTIITQAPGSTLATAEGAEHFLTEMRPRYGGWTSILYHLGFFNIYTSWLFLIITALLAISIIACTVHRIPQLWQRATRPRTHVSGAFFTHARYRAELPAEGDAASVLAALDEAAAAKGLRVVADEKDPHARYLDKNRWGPFGTVAAHASFVIILAAFAISSLAGIDEQLTVPVGSSVPVGHDSGLTLAAESFTESFYDDGSPSDYVSHLRVLDGDAVVAEQDVRVNSPLKYGGFSFHQAFYGIAADLRIVDEDGSEIYAGSVPLRFTSEDKMNSIGRIDLPEAGIDVIVVTPASGRADSPIPAGTAVIEMYPTGQTQPLDVKPVTQGQEAAVAGKTVTFERERQYTGINLRQDPGTWWMWIGSILLVGGSLMTFGMRHRRIWARVIEGEDGPSVQFASAEKTDSGFGRFFTDTVTAVNERLLERPTDA
ncbi:cytochrome c biogenesis protein ResB [Bowdeniella massiliensis]|uniref:cytochrome c biogenesis protein ResB n=1 Tax=Bowdeniella massiliensis TaxID=2932264 RepID=UPI00202824C9|nr:cytochrome c biogenesis protein ResB [Bowdeniella massiliensis]